MRLSTVLSKDQSVQFQQIEGFWENKKGDGKEHEENSDYEEGYEKEYDEELAIEKGESREIDVGIIELSFFCENCKNERIFESQKNLICIYIDESSVSIDCVLKCEKCNSTVPTWFLIKSKGKITASNLEVKIIKRSFKLSNGVSLKEDRLTGYEEMFNKANHAYGEDLGAGSAIYLRKILEQITRQVAEVAGIKWKNQKFEKLVALVNAKKGFIPPDFHKDGKKLYRELNEIVHGHYDEEVALQKYSSRKDIVTEVVEYVNENKSLVAEIKKQDQIDREKHSESN